VLWYPQITSTNDVAASMAMRGAAEGTVVVADMQTAGRGRLGRSWESPPGAGLYVSVVLRPAAAALGLITIAAGAAVAEGIESATGLRPAVKWPNDVYAAARKLAGILAEAGTSGAVVQHVVVGIGVNVMPARWPPAIAARATSLETEAGRAVDRGWVFAECLAALAARYRDLREGRTDAVLDAWRQRAASTFGRSVEWEAAGRTVSGIVEDIDETGALIVRSQGTQRRIVAGEVRWTA
jgi:BirA family biotin operon repressor/biotin-[acetyl-CoA-carboxylase] ligase